MTGWYDKGAVAADPLPSRLLRESETSYRIRLLSDFAERPVGVELRRIAMKAAEQLAEGAR